MSDRHGWSAAGMGGAQIPMVGGEYASGTAPPAGRRGGVVSPLWLKVLSVILTKGER